MVYIDTFPQRRAVPIFLLFVMSVSNRSSFLASPELHDDVWSETSSVFDSAPNSPDSAKSEQFFEADGKSEPLGSAQSSPQKHLRTTTPRPLPKLHNHVFNPRFGVKVSEQPHKVGPARFASGPFSTTSAEQRLPPTAAAAQRRNSFLRQREMTLAQVKPNNVLKVKIFYNEEVVALKLRKDLLSNIKELVEVTLYKLYQRHTFSRDKMSLSISFADSALKPVSLSASAGSAFASYHEDLCMDYIQTKLKIFITAQLK